jgi:27-O-demethylrifamycin SV methyltransferase
VIPFAELRERRRDFAVLRSAFGAARMDSLEEYADYAERAGLRDVACVDLTRETLPTFDRWQANLDAHRVRVTELLGVAGVADFEESIRILRGFWLDGTLGYGLVTAERPPG